MKKIIDFYFVDNINFHKRNFNNFISYVEENFSYAYNNAYPALKKCFGRYELKKIKGLPNFNKYEALFGDLDEKNIEEIKKISYKGYLLWDIIYAELYAYLIPKMYSLFIENKINLEKNSTLIEQIQKYRRELEDETLKNLFFYNFTVGAFWIDYWASMFKKQKINNVCVFGGTTIYSRAATLVAQWNNINVISFEGSFIKNFHYADNSSGMITNNHRFADHSLWVRLKGLDFLKEQDNWLTQVMEKRLNLNVVQPNKITREQLYKKYNIDPKKKLVLLIGQVVNDFSVTRDLTNYESTIDFYLEVIKYFAEKKDYHLFIKLHPWENHKQNSTTELSKKVLEKKVQLEQINSNNYTIDYDINIESLIDFSDIGITSCSQAGLEMLYAGKRVVQVGNAFYGQKGWTIDVTRPEFLEKAIDIALIHNRLTKDEHKEVKKYIYHLLKNHCFLREDRDENFYKKFNSVTRFLSKKQNLFRSRTRSLLKKIKSKCKKCYNLLKKALKEPKKAFLKVKYRVSLATSIFIAKITSKKIVNMVMGQSTYSKIFQDMLTRFHKELKNDYLMIVTERSIKTADLYHYWRPNASKNDIKHPSIVTVHHDFDRDSESLSIRHFIDSYKKADMILCLNSQQKARIQEFIGQEKPIKVIPHGYDLRFKPKEIYKNYFDNTNKLVIGFSSRRYPRLVKGEETLYKVIEALKDQPVKYLFIGQDRHYEYHFCEKLGVEAEVYEKISYNNYPKLYQQMDLFLITSRAEGGPASLPEALATGIPVISTPCGFVPDMIRNGENGYIVDYDDAESIVKYINYFIQNPDLLNEMGKRAVKTKNLKPWPEIIQEYIKAYEELQILKVGEKNAVQRKRSIG